MIEAGIDVVFFNPLFPRTTGPFALRDHRKILITDNVAFCGSMNISKDAGGTKLGTNFFFDVQARLTGPCVRNLGDVVLDTLELSHSGLKRERIKEIEPICSCQNKNINNITEPTNVDEREERDSKLVGTFFDESRKKVYFSLSKLSNLLSISLDDKKIKLSKFLHENIGMKQNFSKSFFDNLYYKETPNFHELKSLGSSKICEKCSDDSVYVQVLISDAIKGRRDIQTVYTQILQKAEHQILIASSYFLPPGVIRRAIINAQQNGANVRLLLSGGSDIPGDMMATEHTLGRYLPYGIRVFKSAKHKHMHSKFCVVDNKIGTIGSFNLDRLSYRRNLEVVVAFYHPKSAMKLASIHKKYTSKQYAEEYTYHDWKQRNFVKEKFYSVVHFFARLSAKNFLDGLSNISSRKILLLNFLLDVRTPEHIATGMSYGLC